jgi:heme/copper-type cytochrome/quinol oxidase subunit 2
MKTNLNKALNTTLWVIAVTIAGITGYLFGRIHHDQEQAHVKQEWLNYWEDNRMMIILVAVAIILSVIGFLYKSKKDKVEQ